MDIFFPSVVVLIGPGEKHVALLQIRTAGVVFKSVLNFAVKKAEVNKHCVQIQNTSNNKKFIFIGWQQRNHVYVTSEVIASEL
jgi:hypothetical protein